MKTAAMALPVLLICSILVAEDNIPAGTPLVKTGIWADQLGTHPILFGPKAHLKALAASDPRPYADIKKMEIDPSKAAMETSGSIYITAGVIHAVDGLDPKLVKALVNAAMDNVKLGATNTHQDTWVRMDNVALAYDFFYDDISADDKAKIIAWFNEELSVYNDKSGDELAFHNSILAKITTYLRIAVATWKDNPKAKDFLEYATKKLYEGRLMPVFNEFGAGGGFTESGGYTKYCLWPFVNGLELTRRCGLYDGFAKAPRFFYQRMAYELYNPYPGLWTYGSERYPQEGDSGPDTYGSERTENPRHVRTLLADYFHGSELSKYVAAKKRKGSSDSEKFMDFLYGETSKQKEEPLDISTLPLAHLAEGIGRVYARGSWKDDAAWFRFECGDWWAEHNHFEAGNFEIFKNEPLATESGEYVLYDTNHSMNWLIRTIAHNCILVFNPAETWTVMRDGGRTTYANDGGQAPKSRIVPTLEEWKAKKTQFNRSTLLAYDTTPEYLYVAGDFTKAYSEQKMKQWVRQIVFLRPDTFVIFDKVVSTKPEFEKTWVLHGRNEPVIKDNTFVFTNGKGKLTGQILLPTKVSVSSVNGYTYGGKTFDLPANPSTATANKWRIEIKPKESQTEDVFVNVLSTADALINAVLSQIESQITITLGPDKVIFNKETGGAIEISGKKKDLALEIKRGKFE